MRNPIPMHKTVAAFSRGLGVSVIVASLIATLVAVGCDETMSPEVAGDGRGSASDATSGTMASDEPRGERESGISGSRSSTLGKAMDTAEKTLDEYQQKSQDLADDFDQ